MATTTSTAAAATTSSAVATAPRSAIPSACAPVTKPCWSALTRPAATPCATTAARSVSASAQSRSIDVPNQTGNVVAEPGAIANLDAGDDGAGNLLVTVNDKTVTITDHFNDADNVAGARSISTAATFDGINLGSADYNLVAAATGVTTLNGSATADALFGTGLPTR